MCTNVKGDRRERELINILDQGEAGIPEKYAGIFEEDRWAVMRAPASGAATLRELPDVLFGDGEVFYAVEAKSSQRDVAIYIDKEEIEALEYFAENFGAEPRLGIRYDYHDWAFFHPDDLHRTDSGNVRVREDDLPDGETLHDL